MSVKINEKKEFFLFFKKLRDIDQILDNFSNMD